MILGGRSAAVRRLAISLRAGWNLSAGSVEEFRRLKGGQPDPQAQVFTRAVGSVSETVAAYRAAGATRLVFVLQPPLSRLTYGPLPGWPASQRAGKLQALRAVIMWAGSQKRK